MSFAIATDRSHSTEQVILVSMFEIRARYVNTRNGQILVMERRFEWFGALVIRVLLMIGASVVAIIAPLFGNNDLEVSFWSLGVCTLILLTFVPWQVVAIKIVARRLTWIAGKPPKKTPHTIRTMDDRK